MRAPHRPLVVIPDNPGGHPKPARRRDQTVPFVAAAFCLGVVVAASGFLGLSAGDGERVPATVVQDKAAQLSSAEAVVSEQRDRIAAQLTALADAESLQRRLVAALDRPTGLTPEQIKALKVSTERVTRLIERIRVVTVATPGPSRPVPVPAARGPQPTATPEPTPVRTPTATPTPTCRNVVLGVCLLP
jgi:hypothetical protein